MDNGRVNPAKFQTETLPSGLVQRIEQRLRALNMSARKASLATGYGADLIRNIRRSAAARVTDVKVEHNAPPGYDHYDKPGFRRYLRIETTIGTFPSVVPYRCGVNFGVLSAVPDR